MFSRVQVELVSPIFLCYFFKDILSISQLHNNGIYQSWIVYMVNFREKNNVSIYLREVGEVPLGVLVGRQTDGHKTDGHPTLVSGLMVT